MEQSHKSPHKTLLILRRIAGSRSFLITLALAIGLSPIYLLPEYFFPANDVAEQLHPFLHETKRMLSAGAPWWTWQSFLGDNFIGSYAYYTLTRPLLLLVCLLPYKYIGAGLIASVYINFLILGWLSSCYLRVMGFDRRLRLIGSLLFTLSTFMICHLIYCMFFEPVEIFIILLICIERFLRGKRMSATFLTLASFGVAFISYYFMPATMIAGAMYFVCRAFCCYRERRLSLTLKAAGCVLLGIAMASVVLVPVAEYLAHTPRTESVENNSFYVFGRNWILRALSLVAPTPYEGMIRYFNMDSGWHMNMANVLIFGMLPFILYAVRRRLTWLTILCSLFIICLVTPLNGVFDLFTHPYYTRWAYALILMLIVASLAYFRMQRGKIMPRRPALIYCAVTWAFFIAAYYHGVTEKIFHSRPVMDNIWTSYIAAAILFVLNTAALLLLTRWPILSRQWTRACIAGIIAVTVAQCFSICFHYAHLSIMKNTMYDYAARLPRQRSDCDTFAARTYFEPNPERPKRHYNHHLLLNRQAVTSFISTINPATANLSFILQHDNIWEVYLDGYQESAVTLLSVKDFSAFEDYPIEKVPQAALDGRRYIPMGMAYDRYSIMADSLADYKRAKTHDILRGMLASLLIDKADEPELGRYMKPVAFCDTLPFDSLVAARRAYTCDSFKGDTHGFTATISLPDTMVVMFSTAADPGFTATIDGKPSKIYNVNMGMSASIVPPGRHTIRYEFFPPGLRSGAWLSLAAFLIFIGLALYDRRTSRPSGNPHSLQNLS